MISESVRDRLALHLRNETTDYAASDLRVPTSNFRCPDHAAHEIALFRQLPLVVARSSDLPEAGAFLTLKPLGVPLIISRQQDGGIKAFLNICRHRGGQVEAAASGRKRVFTCLYHGWSYEQSGEIRGIPYADVYDSVDRNCSGLSEVQVEERHGSVWVNLSNSGTSVADHLGTEMDSQMSDLRLDSAITYREQTFDLDMNWKLVIDGALDCIHAPFLHRGGVDEYVTSHATAWNDYGLHGQLFTVRKKAASQVKAGEDVECSFSNFTTSLVVFPNTLSFVTPDHIEFWTVWPSSCGRKSQTHIRLLAQPELLDDRMKVRMDRSWSILEHAALKEDWPMAATIQANAEENADGSFLYGRGEITCQHLHRRLKGLLDVAG